MNDSQSILYQDCIPGGAHWSMLMRRGTQLRLTDVEGGANLAMLFYNPLNLLERYNAPDTLKCQHTFKLTAGHCLYSDMGRIFCSIIEDSLGWHDTVSGDTDNTMIEKKWGRRSYQECGNDWTLSGRHSFLVEAGKYGLGKRDLVGNVNWFSKVTVDGDGGMTFIPDHSKAGASVVLRFEMDTLVLLHTCPHPLNPASSYPVKPVNYQISKAAPVTADDLCRNSRPENGRGFENNRLYHLGL